MNAGEYITATVIDNIAQVGIDDTLAFGNSSGFSLNEIATALPAAPVNTVPDAQTVLEDTLLSINGISVNDVNGNLSTVQLSVTNEALNVALSGSTTITSGANGINTLTLSGDQTGINATLTSLTYQGTLNYNGGDNLTILSTDNISATDSDSVTITVSALLRA